MRSRVQIGDHFVNFENFFESRIIFGALLHK
jgi:hypothetical protein